MGNRELEEPHTVLNRPMSSYEEYHKLNFERSEPDDLRVPTKTTRTVIFLGRMGRGKSSLINAIIDRHVCWTGLGLPCTEVATSYAHLDDTDESSGRLEAEVIFFDRAQIKYLMRAHLRLLQAHHVDRKNKPQVHKTIDETAHYLAIGWLQKLAQLNENDLDISEFTNKAAVCESNGQKFAIAAEKLFDQAILAVLQRCGTKVGQEPTQGDLNNCKRAIVISSPTVEKHAKAMEEFVEGRYSLLVREVVVKLKSDALKTGTVLKDLPGIDDKDITRSYVRKLNNHGDYYAIIAKPNEVEDEEWIHNRLARCIKNSPEGAASAMLILTHNEDAAEDKAFIEETLANLDSAPISFLKKRMTEAKERLKRIESESHDRRQRIMKESGREKLVWLLMDEDMELLKAKDYSASIWHLGARAAIADRNKSIRTAMSPKLCETNGNSGKIFFTCPRLYVRHLKGSAPKRCTFEKDETGIPELRAAMRDLSTSGAEQEVSGDGGVSKKRRLG